MRELGEKHGSEMRLIETCPRCRTGLIARVVASCRTRVAESLGSPAAPARRASTSE
jgi:hypothetical protein